MDKHGEYYAEENEPEGEVHISHTSVGYKNHHSIKIIPKYNRNGEEVKCNQDREWTIMTRVDENDYSGGKKRALKVIKMICVIQLP